MWLNSHYAQVAWRGMASVVLLIAKGLSFGHSYQWHFLAVGLVFQVVTIALVLVNALLLDG